MEEFIKKDKDGYATIRFTVDYDFIFDDYVRGLEELAEDYEGYNKDDFKKLVRGWLISDIEDAFVENTIAKNLTSNLLNEVAEEILLQAKIEEI